MLMLDDLPFTTGRATYEDSPLMTSEGTAKIYVKVALSSLPEMILAQVDTGAAWSIVGPSIAGSVGLLGGQGQEVSLSTRLGKLNGRLERTTLILVADHGSDLEVEATIFASEQIPDGWNFLGYNGMLDRIRFALDPSANTFYFGGPAEHAPQP